MTRFAFALAILLTATVAHAQQRTGSTGVVVAALTNTVVTVKAGPGIWDGITCSNPNASTAFVQLFDTTGAVTLGTTAPNHSTPIGPGASAPVLSDVGLNFVRGLKVAATTTIKGNTAPGTPLDCSLAIR